MYILVMLNLIFEYPITMLFGNLNVATTNELLMTAVSQIRHFYVTKLQFWSRSNLAFKCRDHKQVMPDFGINFECHVLNLVLSKSGDFNNVVAI